MISVDRAPCALHIAGMQQRKFAIPDEVWRALDVGGPVALGRILGIPHQVASALMNGKAPNISEVVRILAAFPSLTAADLLPDGHAIMAEVRARAEREQTPLPRRHHGGTERQGASGKRGAAEPRPSRPEG
jgi:hypothetical protein